MQDFRMYLGTYANTQVMRMCTDTYTDTITHLFIAFYVTSLRLVFLVYDLTCKNHFPKKNQIIKTPKYFLKKSWFLTQVNFFPLFS